MLPRVREALAINPQLKVMISPWSPPAWMKTTRSLIQGQLLPQYYPAFANYLARTVQGFEREGVPVSMLTIQNEPDFEPDSYSGMRVNSPDRAVIIGRHVGPLFRSLGLKTQILDYDHNWDNPEMPLTVLADPVARSYIAGVAWHCYEGDVPAQTPVHDAYPDKDAWETECSGGEWSPKFAEVLGWMTDKLIIGASNNWSRGIAAVEPRARSGAWSSQRRLRRLPRRGHDRSGDGSDHPQRRILCARPCQPLRSSRRVPGRDRQARSGDRSGGIPQPRRKPGRDPPSQSGRRSGDDRDRRRAICGAARFGVGRNASLGRPKRAQVSDTAQDGRRTFLAFAAVTTLFFAWGFITSNNDPLIVALRAAFRLNYTEALLTQIVFFLAYGLLSLARRLAHAAESARWTRSSARSALMVCGCLAVTVGTDVGDFWPILAALFVLAAGFTALQVAANPLAAELGRAPRSHFRLNFAQAFNSLGVVLGVHFGSLVMLGDPVLRSSAAPILDPARRMVVLDAVDRAYLIMAALLGVLLIAFDRCSREFLVQRRRRASAVTSPPACSKRCARAGRCSGRSPSVSMSGPRSRSAAS